MQQLQIKSSKLTVVPNPKKTDVRTMASPLPGANGSVFALVKVLGNASEHRERLADIIFEHLDKLIAKGDEQINIPRKFEQVLQKINNEIHTLIQESPKIPITDFHAILGVQIKQQLFLSGIGNLSALFMHRTAKQRYVIYDLDQQLKEDQTWEKPFITVLDGELHPGDVFYVATRVKPREISDGDLQDILVTLPPSGALERIQQHLHRDTAYGALCFQVKDKEESGPPKKVNPLSSIQSLNKSKEETATLLGEQKPEIGNALSRFFQPVLKNLSSPGTKGPKTVFKRLLKSSIQLLVAAITFTGAFVSKIVNLSKHALRKRAGKKESQSSTKKESKPKVSLKDRLGNLPKQSRYIGIGIALIVVLLVGTVFVSRINKNKNAESLATQTVLLRIEEKKNAAEASLIYDDVDQAKSLVAEAIALLETLPGDERNLQAEIDRLRGELNQVLSQIRGVTEVTTATLGDLSGYELTTINTAGETIFAISSSNAVLRFNELEQTWEEQPYSVGSLSTVTTGTNEDANILVVDSSKNLGRVNVENQTMNPVASGTNGMESVEDIYVYNQTVYALTATGEQIVKMRAQGTGFDAGTTWITSVDSDITSAKALAVDGDIYILTNTKIIKLSSGIEQPFELDLLDPTLNQPVDLWTDVDSNFLYVLDPAEARIVVFNKEGRLVTQYFSEDFRSSSQLLVREDQNSILVLASDQVVTFSANHLLQ